MTLQTLRDAIANQRFETARRIGRALLADPTTRTVDIVFGLHDALAALSEYHEALALLERCSDLTREQQFESTLRQAEAIHHLARESQYRISSEARAGLTLEEYLAKYRANAAKRFEAALALAATPDQREMLRTSLHRCRRPVPPELGAIEATATGVRGETITPTEFGSLRGSLVLPDGHPAAGGVVTLGLAVAVDHADPATYTDWAPSYTPRIGPLEKLTTSTDAQGRFVLPEIPVGQHEFLAVTLEPQAHPICTRFVARAISIKSGVETDLGAITVPEWRSAPGKTRTSPHPATRDVDGVTWAKCADHSLHNPFYYDFRRQILRLPLPHGFAASRQALRVEVLPGQPEPHQIVGDELVLMTGLPARTDCNIAIYAADVDAMRQPEFAATDASGPALIEESPAAWILDTGVAQFRIPGPEAAADSPPLLSVCGADRRWRGHGRFVLPDGITITKRSTSVLDRGPVFIKAQIEYHLSNDLRWTLTLVAYRGEAFLDVNETSSALPGAAFEFSLREFSGGRAFRHWTRESPDGGRHWFTLEKTDTVVASLPESVPWWVPPQAFACAFTPDTLLERDYLAVFSLRRGEWIDREFARLCNGPVNADGTPNHELDWPYPEMLGSSISMITAGTRADGDIYFRFGFFDGERRWGLLVSSLDANDGVWKELSAVQHAYSSPRLQEFKDWHFDVPDTHARPHVIANREQLVALRTKARSSRFRRLWEKIREGHVRGPGLGLAFAIEGDPLIAWRKRIELLGIAEIRSRMTLLGRDWSDMYSPVLGRPITEWVEEYDLVAASGVFNAEEERTVRAFFVLMGHMYMEPDFMNWQFNARNANFEADRTDIVGAIGVVFDGHPDAEKFQRHVVDLTKRSLLAYCTPGSGKWQENPACYYLQNAKCRMNLVYHLVQHRRLRLDEIPLLRDFLRWGIVLLTPPHPVAYSVMRDGGGEARFDRAEKVRKIPPIGDHATIGRWLPEHYATIGRLFREIDPAFSRELMDAYFLANADGQRLLTRYAAPVEQEGEQLFHDIYSGATFGNLPLFFTTIEEADIPEAPSLALTTRRLEGFGAVLRHRVGSPHEGYVLLKQGPGGYRYHRTEGSFLLFVDGKPLVFDGGEAGETWRHSTLAFHDVHMPLMPGRLERCFATPRIHLTQGMHAGAISPGQPVFLGDTASHELVSECHRRFTAPPAVTRSLAWLDGQTLVVHDAIELPPEIPSHWHLQVVGNAPTGDAVSGYRFPGRFGVDLQVLFPGQTFAASSLEHLPVFEYRGAPQDWFAMQHLCVSAPGARNYLAVLHPSSASPLRTVESLRAGDRLVGVHLVQADGSNSRVWLSREQITSAETDYTFSGASGALLLRSDEIALTVVGNGTLRYREWTLESEGAEVSVEVGGGGPARLLAQGSGRVRVTRDRETKVLSVSGTCELALF